MAEQVISPGVFTNETDSSFLPAGIQAIGAAVIGPTQKGPAGIPITVSSYSEYLQKFGSEFSSGSGATEASYKYLTNYTAQEYLKYADTLTVVRILGGSYSPATSSIQTAGTADVFATGSFDFGSLPSTNNGFRIVNASDTIVATFIAGASNYAIPGLGLYYYDASSFNNALTQINTYVTQLSASWDASTTLILSGSSVGTAVNGWAIQTGSSTDLTTSGSSLLTDVATIGGGTSTSENVFTLTTLADGDDQNSLSTEGTNGLLPSGSLNNIRWEVSNVNNSKGTFTLTIRRGNDTNNRKIILEQFNNVTLDPNSSNYIAKLVGDQSYTLRDSGTSDPFLQLSGSYQNRSSYVRVTVHKNTYNYLDANGNVRLGSLSGSLPAAGSGSFGGGSNGTVEHPIQFNENITNTNTQGFNLGSGQAGYTAYIDAIRLLKNQDEYDINLITLPGVVDNFSNHANIITEAVSMVEARGDAFLVYDPVEYGQTIAQAAAKAEARDTNYAGVYWPWLKVPDNDLGRNVWVPASTLIPSVYAFNDRVAAPWFAPAGLNRGGIDIATETERKLSKSNRDTLYDSNVNPIATFPNTGIAVYGQKTLQKKASALDRVNVRRLLIAAKKFVASTSRYLVFEQNTSATRNRFLSIVNPYFENVQQRQGLYAFKVVMDETTNTPDVIDRNELRGKIFMQPSKTAEFIIIDFNVLPTGAEFPQ